MAEEAFKAYQEFATEQRSAAEGARVDEKDSAETEEEYYERVRSVPGIFGDTDTTAGSDASGLDVPSSQNEISTVLVAEKDVAAEGGDEEAAAVSDDEARGNVSAGRPNEDEAQEAAEEAGRGEPSSAIAGVGPSTFGNDGAEGSSRRSSHDSSEDSEAADEDAEDTSSLTADEKVDRINSAETVGEVDRLAAEDSRVTVKRAADRKREELNA